MTVINLLTPYLLQLAISLCILLCFLITSRKQKQKKDLEKKYSEALNAIVFLLHTEEKHCRNNEENFDKTLRNTMRKQTNIENNIIWNSKFSMGNCMKEINKIKDNKLKNKNVAIEALQMLFLKAVK